MSRNIFENLFGKKSLDFSFIIHYNRTMKQYKKRPWTHDERTLLRSTYHIVDKEVLQNQFPDRTMNSIRKQVHYLKKRGWTFDKRKLI